ncbi:MAG TPA: hypothetical protein VKB35_09300 [Ktedonobacteraceae bacterium]|nr:hypothetical protein [Ktedonobacteraceae bacterium]
MAVQNERLASVEARLDTLVPVVNEIRGDVKALLAAHNRERGAAKVLALIWAGLLTLGATVTGIVLRNRH